MGKTEMVIKPSVASELLPPVIEAVLSLPEERVDYWHDRPDELRDEILRVISNGHQNLMAELKSWERLYDKFFGMKVNLSRLVIPARREGFNRLLVIAQGLTPTGILEKMLGNGMRVFRKFNLSELKSVRNPDTHYVLWVRDSVESDENLVGISAHNLRAMSVSTITLVEEMVFECRFFHDTGNHLNVRSVTLCGGSHMLDGKVPGVVLEHGSMTMLSLFDPSEDGPSLRAREVVV